MRAQPMAKAKWVAEWPLAGHCPDPCHPSRRVQDHRANLTPITFKWMALQLLGVWCLPSPTQSKIYCIHCHLLSPLCLKTTPNFCSSTSQPSGLSVLLNQQNNSGSSTNLWQGLPDHITAQATLPRPQHHQHHLTQTSATSVGLFGN